MNNLIPEYIVHMSASRCDGERSTKTGHRLPIPVTGILFSKDNCSVIIGAAAKQYEPDGIRIDTIMGIGSARAQYRNMLSKSIPHNLASTSMNQSYEHQSQGWALLAAQIHDDERPGRMEPGIGFVAASPIGLPSPTAFGIADAKIRDDTAFCVFGIRSAGTGTETVVVPAKLARTNTTGTVFVLPSGKLDGVEFGGAPILNTTGRLVAMSLFSGTHTSGSSAVVAIPIRQLIDKYGRIIEGVL